MLSPHTHTRAHTQFMNLVVSIFYRLLLFHLCEFNVSILDYLLSIGLSPDCGFLCKSLALSLSICVSVCVDLYWCRLFACIWTCLHDVVFFSVFSNFLFFVTWIHFNCEVWCDDEPRIDSVESKTLIIEIARASN